MPAILKSAEFALNAESIVLNELSALERFDYIEYVDTQQASDEDSLHQLNKKTLFVSAYLVAISYARSTGKSREEQHQDILSNWPPQLIAQAHAVVSELSGFAAINETAEQSDDQDQPAAEESPAKKE